MSLESTSFRSCVVGYVLLVKVSGYPSLITSTVLCCGHQIRLRSSETYQPAATADVRLPSKTSKQSLVQINTVLHSFIEQNQYSKRLGIVSTR